MSLTINWNAANGASSYKLYRSATGRFTTSNLPTDVLTIATPTVSHEYTDVVSNKVYWFMVSSLDSNNVETYGQVFSVGYFPDTGPGPTSLIRGDWDFGFFGEVPVSSLFSASEIGVALTNKGTAGSRNATDPTKYFKVVVNGRILYIPDTYRQYFAFTTNASMITVLGTLGFATPITSGIPLSKGGYDFNYRMPSHTLVDANYLAVNTLDVTALDYLKSEVAMISALCGSVANPVKPGLTAQNSASAPGVYYPLSDGVIQANTLVGLGAAANQISVLSNAGVITTTTAVTAYIVPVLELQL